MGIDFPAGGHHIHPATFQGYRSSAETVMEHNLSAQCNSQFMGQYRGVSLNYKVQVFHQSAQQDITHRPAYQVYRKDFIQSQAAHRLPQNQAVTTDAVLDSVEGGVDVLSFWRGRASCAAIIA
jgi:hypothetical protein